MTLPVKIRSFAFAMPSKRVSRCVPPAPGIMPSFVSGSPILVTACPSRTPAFSTIHGCSEQEPRALTGNPQVARQTHLQPATERGPINGGDGGHGKVLEGAEGAAEVDEELVDLRLGHGRALDEVRACAERADGRGADDEHARASCV